MSEQPAESGEKCPECGSWLEQVSPPSGGWRCPCPEFHKKPKPSEPTEPAKGPFKAGTTIKVKDALVYLSCREHSDLANAGFFAGQKDYRDRWETLRAWLSKQCHDGSLLPVIAKMKELER